jgi:hypothetical protein
MRGKLNLFFKIYQRRIKLLTFSYISLQIFLKKIVTLHRTTKTESSQPIMPKTHMALSVVALVLSLRLTYSYGS